MIICIVLFYIGTCRLLENGGNFDDLVLYEKPSPLLELDSNYSLKLYMLLVGVVINNAVIDKLT